MFAPYALYRLRYPNLFRFRLQSGIFLLYRFLNLSSLMITGGRGPVVKVATSMSYRDQDCSRILLGQHQTKGYAVILLRNPKGVTPCRAHGRNASSVAIQKVRAVC